MVPSFAVVFIISVFMFELFYRNVVDFCLFIQFLLLICQWYCFLLFKVNYLYCVYSEAFTKLFHAISTSAYVMLIFYTITCSYRRHWIPTENMFTYFCWRWSFKIVVTSIYFLDQRFKIYISNIWCLVRFSVLIKL